MSGVRGFCRVATMVFILAVTSAAVAAEDGVWRVGKSSGEVWMTTTSAQQVSLTQEDSLKPGDTIRTGRNGRVLLTRGEESILVSPNSVIGLPTQKKEGLSTTIVQQAGSILLEVEKRNVQHFEVETPYLAAVVKGTQFRVTVNAASTSVDVVRGQVEVSDFRSGQVAQVMPGQHATTFAQGKPGLSLGGSGTLSPIEQGRPRPSSIQRIPVPRTGLAMPRQASNGSQVQRLGKESGSARLPSNSVAMQSNGHPGIASTRPGVTRISSSLGEVRLNFQRVTHGLARGSAATPGTVRNANRDTVWSSREARANSNYGSSNQGNSSDGSSGNAAIVGGTTATTGVTAPVRAANAGANNAGNGNGNGNGAANGNGNGNAHGSGANGNGNGNGNGNNGNGYGSGGNGNGNGNGHAYGHTK